jgi:hypothetical protein
MVVMQIFSLGLCLMAITNKSLKAGVWGAKVCHKRICTSCMRHGLQVISYIHGDFGRLWGYIRHI